MWSEACGGRMSWSLSLLLLNWHWINIQSVCIWKVICVMKITSYLNLPFKCKLYKTFLALNSLIRGQGENEVLCLCHHWLGAIRLVAMRIKASISCPVSAEKVVLASVWIILLVVKHICTFLWWILNKGEIIKTNVWDISSHATILFSSSAGWSSVCGYSTAGQSFEYLDCLDLLLFWLYFFLLVFSKTKP